MKKKLITISSYSDDGKVTRDLKRTIGSLMIKLKNEGFWRESDPTYKTTDVFRDVFRNVTSHYSTSDESLTLDEYDGSEALFAYFMSLTLILYLLERLNDFKSNE